MSRTLILIAVVAVVEAVGIYAAVAVFGGGPQASHGAHGESVVHGPEPSEHPPSSEVELLTKFRVPNTLEGRMWIYELDLIVLVPGHRREDFDKLKGERMGAISDAVAAIVRSLEPRELNDPHLKTLRTQIQRALAELSGDPELIDGILVPRCVPSRG